MRFFAVNNCLFYFIILFTASEIYCDSYRSWVEYNSSTGEWIGGAECQFDNNYNPSQLSWHFQGRRIDSDSYLENEKVINEFSEDGVVTTLYINKFSQANVGDYSCLRVTNFAQVYYSQWISPPPLLWLDSGQQVNDGDPVSISCQTFSQAELYWVLPGLTSLNVSNVTTKNNVTSQIEFIALSNNNYAEIKCCLKKKDDQRTIIPCSSTYINVYSEPVIKFKEANCTDSNCDLQCVFQSFPDIKPQDMFWTACDQEGACRNIPTSDNYFDAETHQIFSKIKNYNLKSNEFVKCQANNSMGTIDHKFHLESNYSSPLINSIETSFESNDSNIFEINCIFKANPTPIHFSWFKQNYINFSNGWENINEVEYSNYEISTEALSFDTIRSTLSILNYDSKKDYANFSCCADNINGEVSCAQTVAYLQPGIGVVNVSHSSPLNGEEVVVSCSAFGTPLPQIELVVLTEFDLNYTLTTDYNENMNEVILTFFADWFSNNVINILCYSFDIYFLDENIQPQQTSIYVNNNSSIYSVSNSSSQLLCVAQRSNSDVLINAKWIYWSEEWTNEVNIYDDVRVISLSPYQTELVLFLNQSNFGIYTCRFSYLNYYGFSYDVDYDFHFDTFDNGANLQEECSSSDQCIHLYASCINQTCVCQNPYKTTNDSYPACFKGVGPFGPCNIDEQCVTAGNNFFCSQNNICDCNGVYEDIPDAESYLCLQPVIIGNPCEFYEECSLGDKFSMCVNNICICADNYIFNLTTDCCTIDYSPSPDPVDEDDSLSMGAIVGIIIGSTAVIIMIICIIGLIVGRRRGLI